MIIVERKKIEGKKIAILDTDTPLLSEVYQKAVDLAKRQGHKFDEFHLTINSCNFIFDKDVRVEDLERQFTNFVIRGGLQGENQVPLEDVFKSVEYRELYDKGNKEG